MVSTSPPRTAHPPPPRPSKSSRGSSPKSNLGRGGSSLNSESSSILALAPTAVRLPPGTPGLAAPLVLVLGSALEGAGFALGGARPASPSSSSSESNVKGLEAGLEAAAVEPRPDPAAGRALAALELGKGSSSSSSSE